MGTKIGIILVDEEDTKENLIGGKQKNAGVLQKLPGRTKRYKSRPYGQG